jgi:hypothetical protein
VDVYGYCLDDPINLVDPMGNFAVAAAAIPGIPGIAGALGALAGIATGGYIGTKITEEMNKEDEVDPNLKYGEHSKRGSTNKANKSKHEKGNARRNKDQGGEKKDSPHQGDKGLPQSNRRRKQAEKRAQN